MLGDLVSAGLGVQGMSWVTSPAATELEQHVMDWFADLLGLPGVLPLRPARAAASSRTPAPGPTSSPCSPPCTGPAGGATLRHGVEPDRATVYVSSETHSSMEKAVRIAGLGTDAVRIVEVDGDLAMRPRRSPPGSSATSPAATPRCWSAPRWGRRRRRRSTRWPSSAPICQKYGVWLHVDAAYAGVSAVVPELRALQAGVEWADSYTTDAHKWLLTGFDATLFWVADRAALTGALSILPEYLRNAATEAGAVVDFRDWQIPLGRRFRALKLWFVLRWYGAEGLRAHIRSHVALRPGAGRLGRGRRAVRRRRPRTRCRWSACAPAGPTAWTPTSPP